MSTKRSRQNIPQDKELFKNTFRFDFSPLKDDVARIKSKCKSGSISFSLPDKVTVAFTPSDKERLWARNIFLNIRNKRVLNPRLCDPLETSENVKGFNEMRQILQKLEVEIGDIDSPIYLLLQYAIEAIRQLRAFDERFTESKEWSANMDLIPILRNHLLHILKIIIDIAGIKAKFDDKYVNLPDTAILRQNKLPKEEQRVDSVVTFRWVGKNTEAQLRYLFNTLSEENGFLNKEDYNKFRVAFAGERINEPLNIAWLCLTKDGKHSSKADLLTFIEFLANKGYISLGDVNNTSLLYKRIQFTFCNANGSPLKYLRDSYNSKRDKTRHSKMIKEIIEKIPS